MNIGSYCFHSLINFDIVARRPSLRRFCIAQQCHYCNNTSEGEKEAGRQITCTINAYKYIASPHKRPPDQHLRSFSASTSELVRGLSRHEYRTWVHISHVQGVSLSGHDYHDPPVG